MVAYSFQPQFAPAIKVGLGIAGLNLVYPKRQTIRAHRNGRGRHARPGETLQLYVRQRHPSGYKIGEARCTAVRIVSLRFRARGDYVLIETPGRGMPAERLSRRVELETFAHDDGFSSWDELRRFWDRHHPGVMDFSGTMICWEPMR